jgi:hypothetical protein
MIPHLRPACLALGLVAAATPAAAQNWYYENGARWSPAGAATYADPYTVAPAPYLTPAQRTIVDRTVIPQGNGRAPIVRERVVTDTYAPGVAVTAPVAPTVATDYAYVPRYSAPLARTYAYGARPLYNGAALDDYAYAPRYTAPLAEPYVYGARPVYTEPVVDSYAYVPRPPLPVTESYAYVPAAPAVSATVAESYAYVPNGAVGPRVVYERDSGYCARRYRSYDAASGTFLGFDGLRHACP